MSVLSREPASEAGAEDTRGGLPPVARTVVLVRAAGPAAKTAGVAARDGARSAATWAAPHVNAARAWTAPRIESGGLIVRDTVGPRIYEVLAATARRVEVTAPRVDVDAPRRRWSRILAGAAVLAAATVAAAIVLRRRNCDGTGGAPGESAAAGTGPQAAQDGQAQDGQAHADGDGGAGVPDGGTQSKAT
jgi:hypothetical protein